MSRRLDGKVAIVIGSLRGIGQACCDVLLEQGAKLLFGDVLEALGQSREVEYNAKSGQGQARFFLCDVTNDDDIKRIFRSAEKCFNKRPDIVLTTVGIIDEFDFQKCININVLGCIRVVNAALDVMAVDKGGQGGVVVITSSISGSQPEYWGPVYSASKHALIGLTRSWALEKHYCRNGVRFNCICPSTVDTEFLKQTVNGYFAEEHEPWNGDNMMTPSFIAEGFLQLVENSEMNGKAMRFTKTNGIDFETFREWM